MPGLTGIQLAHELWRIRPDLPLVLCTGSGSSVTPEQATALGFRAYLAKPFSRQDLAAVLRQALALK